MRDWVRSLISPSVRERVSGTPPSGNGASSFHLWWDLPYGERLTAASITINVVRRPDLDRLTFFAMQVAFVKPGGGAAHIGLQHHPRFPGRSAVNWGGYDPDGGFLEGTESSLPSSAGDVNTRDFPWREGVPYRLEVERSHRLDDDRWAWEGSVTDLGIGQKVLVRYLYNRSEFLRGPVVWVESFAPCDAPRSEVRWSDARVMGEDHISRSVHAMRVDYQPHAAGGCTNTNTVLDGYEFVQRTGQLRTTKPGTTLSIG